MNILNWIIVKPYRTLKKYLSLTLKVMLASVLVTVGSWKIWEHNLDKLKEQVSAAPASASLSEIYFRIRNATEVSGRVPPMYMWDSMSSLLYVNAFTTGKGVYVSYRADNELSEDEKAVLIGHEIAHVILHHTDIEYGTFVHSYSNEDELMADNVGSTWAHKAGYDVCKGRELFKKFYVSDGNDLNGSHPPNSIRYENLEHYCKEQK